MAKVASNPVQRRIDLLDEQWGEFVERPDARLLHWVVQPDELRIVEAFLVREQSAEIGECPDVFLRFDQPFENSRTHGHALREALMRTVEESREGMVAEGLPAAWRCPPVIRGESDLQVLLSACRSLRAYYKELCDHLVLVLTPEQVVDAQAYLQWLRQFLLQGPEPFIRLVVLDDARTRAFEPLARQEPTRVKTVVAQLDMPGALEEISREAGELDTPGGRFRELFVRLGNAATRRDTAEVARLGHQAVELARVQGWHHLVVAAHFVMGASLLGADKPLEAIRHYRLAERSAEAAEQGGDPHGRPLRLKSRLALGAALVTAEGYPQAATLYQDTAPLARALQDVRMELECWRMASYCHEQARALKEAWDCGLCAWRVGKALDAVARTSSTLPYVAEALMRLCDGRILRHHAGPMEEEIVSVLGPRWRPRPLSVGGSLS